MCSSGSARIRVPSRGRSIVACIRRADARAACRRRAPLLFGRWHVPSSCGAHRTAGTHRQYVTSRTGPHSQRCCYRCYDSFSSCCCCCFVDDGKHARGALPGAGPRARRRRARPYTRQLAAIDRPRRCWWLSSLSTASTGRGAMPCRCRALSVRGVIGAHDDTGSLCSYWSAATAAGTRRPGCARAVHSVRVGSVRFRVVC